MAASRSEAIIATRERRALFQRAVRENVSMEEARRRAAAERWAHLDHALAQRRAPCAIAAGADGQDAGRPLQWWQK